MTNKKNSRRSFIVKSAIASLGVALVSPELFASVRSPFEGYNPYSEASRDLRVLHDSKNIEIFGQLLSKDGVLPISNAKMEVWHLTRGAKKYSHRGHFFTDSEGRYSFISNFPGREKGEKPKVFFKVSKQGKEMFAKLLLDSNGAYILKDHWEQHRGLNDRVFPRHTKIGMRARIEFNFTLY